MSLSGLQTNTSGNNRWMPNVLDLKIQEQNTRRDEQRDIQEAYEMGNPLLANYLEMKLAKKTGEEAIVKRIKDEDVIHEAQKRLIRKRMRTPRGGITQSLPGLGFIPNAPPIPPPPPPPFIPAPPPLPPPPPFNRPILRPVRPIIPPAPPLPALPPPQPFRVPVLRPVRRPGNIPPAPPIPAQQMLYGRPFVMPRLNRVVANRQETDDRQIEAWNRQVMRLNQAMDADDEARARAAVIRAQAARAQYERQYGPTLGRTPSAGSPSPAARRALFTPSPSSRSSTPFISSACTLLFGSATCRT